MLLPVGVLLGVISLVIAFRFQAQADADIKQLQVEINNAGNQQTALIESIDYAGQLQDTIDVLAGDLSAIKQKGEYFTNAVKYVSNLGLMMQSMPENIAFSSIELRENGITLHGYASDPHNIVKFADELESPGDFSEANILWINKNDVKTTPDGSTNTRFLLVINK